MFFCTCTNSGTRLLFPPPMWPGCDARCSFNSEALGYADDVVVLAPSPVALRMIQ